MGYLTALESAWSQTSRLWAPPPRLSTSEWADQHYVLSPESAGRGSVGRWTTFPYQRGMMDAISDPDLKRVTVKKSSRVGYTKILNADIGRCIHIAPCGMLVVQPTVEDAEGYSKEEIAPMVRDVDVLRARVRDSRDPEGNSTILHKLFPGGILDLIGANSSRGFRRITRERIYFDEIDEFPLTAGSEGDQLSLGEARARDADEPKFVYGSSPRLKGGRIDRQFQKSDQRFRVLPCPHCDHGQHLRWGGRDCDYGIQWPDGHPEEAYYLCEQCREPIAHAELEGMDERGAWIPGRAREGQGWHAWEADPDAASSEHVGFFVWAAYSYLPQSTWGALAREYLDKKDDPSEFQVFINTVLGESYEEQYEALPEQLLAARRKPYPVVEELESEETGEVREIRLVPKHAAILCAGVDTQDDRLEGQVVGFGAGEEAWPVEYQVFYGDPSTQALWDELDEWIVRPRRMERGGVDFIRATCVDTAGHHSDSASAFCGPRYRQQTPDGRFAYVFAIHAQGGAGTIWPREASRRNKQRIPKWPIRVDPAKDKLARRLDKIEEPGPGYIHFPSFFGETYFQQLTAEKRVPRKKRDNTVSYAWELKAPGRRNEAWDTLVYAYAALRGLVDGHGVDFDEECQWLEELLDGGDPDAPPPPPTPPASRSRTRKPVRRSQQSGWMEGRRGRKRWIE